MASNSPGRCLSSRSAAATGTERDASLTHTTGPLRRGEIFTAVWAREVVAPPISSGISRPSRSISTAKLAISSSDGVIRPDSPMMSASCSFAASRIF
ncbi:Uncharacterised protein [Mycobacteroides abscessus subsp. abscessus]|nr:Uncharacterised protein [Mycobacteroides abscessus subsp. abscessus]